MTSQPNTLKRLVIRLKVYFPSKIRENNCTAHWHSARSFLFFNIAFRIPYFQKSAVSALSLTISSYLGTHNSIESISLSGLTEFRINNVYVEDPNKDTLILQKKFMQGYILIYSKFSLRGLLFTN